MGKDYIETIPRKVKDAEIASDSIDHTAIADSFIKTDSGDPAASNDTGEGYIVGSLWFNTTSGEQFVATSVSAEDAVWYGQLGEVINPPFTLEGSTYGFYVGGDGPVRSDKITRLTFAAPSDASDVAEMIGHRTNLTKGSCRNTTHSFITGGYTYSGYGSNPCRHRSGGNRRIVVEL